MSYNRTVRTAAVVAALLAGAVAFAYNPSVRHFKKDSYRAATQNWGVACNEDRIAFFANNEGVLIFDSEKWTLIHNHNRTNVRSLWFDPEENAVYAGSTNELGKITAGEGCDRIVYTSLLDSLGITTSEIWNIGRVNGKLFFQDDRHVYILWERGVRTFGFDAPVLCSEVVDDRLYVFAGGVGCMRLNSGKFETVPGTEDLKDRRVCSILKRDDGTGRLRFVTRRHGVFVLEDGRLSEEKYPFSDRLKESIAYTAAAEGDNIAFGTVTDGVFICNLRSGEWYNLNSRSGLGNNTVLGIGFDGGGNIWATLDNGISYIDLSAPERKLFGDNDIYGTGYAACIWKSRLYLGTNQGLFVTDYPLRTDSGYRRCGSRIGQVWDLSVRDGSLFCCHDAGIDIMYPDGSESHIPLNGTWKLENPGVPGLLVGCTYGQFFTLRKNADGKWAFSGFISGADDASKAFCFDIDGRMWLAHWVKGLFRLTFNGSFTEVISNEYFSERDGFPTSFNNFPNITCGKVLFSTEGGFYRYDSSLGKAVPVDSLNHRFNFTPVATRLYKTTGGDDFYSSGKIQALGYRNDAGAYTIDSLTIRYLAEKRPLGFECTLCMDDGKILLNTEDGFSIISTDAVKNRKTESSPLIIRNITAVSGSKEKTVFENLSSRPPERLVLAPDENTLRFTYRMVEYRMKDAVTYSCMMEGYDSDWSLSGNSCTKEYTRLPYGAHRFRVMAYNILTGESGETAVDFYIKYPWYLTKWAFAIYVVLFGVFVFCLYVLARKAYEARISEISRRKEKEMQEKQMKNELRNKANDLATSTMNLIRKNEGLIDIQESLNRAEKMLHSGEKPEKIIEVIGEMRDSIDSNIRHDDDWKKFERNFDIVYDEYLTRLGKTFPELTVSDKKLCAYLKMGLSSKEIAPLLNLTFRSVEMTRYRLRKKLDLTREQNLTDFLQRF